MNNLYVERHVLKSTKSRSVPFATLASFRHVQTSGKHLFFTHCPAFISMAEEPFHPDRNFAFPKKNGRSCQSQWFVDFLFFHYDVARDVILCNYCGTAVQQKTILTSKRPDPAFVSVLYLLLTYFSRLLSLQFKGEKYKQS